MEIKLKKSLGQNFLINTGILDKIAEAAELKKNDTILEIGPGTGNLTLKLVEGDILEFKPKEYDLKEGGYKIVANIPYYITSNLLRIIFEKWPKPELLVLTVQKEVAQRIVAKPPDMNLLALSVQIYSEPKIIGYISRGSFRPIPKVDSAIIKLVPRLNNNLSVIDLEKFFKLIKTAFSGKRKQLKNTLGVNSTARPEELSLQDWLKLVGKL